MTRTLVTMNAEFSDHIHDGRSELRSEPRVLRGARVPHVRLRNVGARLKVQQRLERVTCQVSPPLSYSCPAHVLSVSHSCPTHVPHPARVPLMSHSCPTRVPPTSHPCLMHVIPSCPCPTHVPLMSRLCLTQMSHSCPTSHLCPAHMSCSCPTLVPPMSHRYLLHVIPSCPCPAHVPPSYPCPTHVETKPVGAKPSNLPPSYRRLNLFSLLQHLRLCATDYGYRNVQCTAVMNANSGAALVLTQMVNNNSDWCSMLRDRDGYCCYKTVCF